MPLVERVAAFAPFSTTAPTGPFPSMNASSSAATATATSSPAPESPHAVSTRLRLQPPAGKPPISPPTAHAPFPRMSPTTNASKAPVPSLTRLPSLTAHRPTLHHLQQQQQQLPHILHHHERPSVVIPTPPPSATAEPPTPRELAARLALLLHARECCTPFDQERVCGVRNCRVARGVLDHCQECFLPEGQCHRSCSEAKHLLRHFRICRAQQFAHACGICDLLRSEFAWAMRHARSLTPLFVPNSGDDSNPPTAPHRDETQRRHSSYHPDQYEAAAPFASLRRSVSEGPSLTMSAMGHHKRAAAAGGASYGSAMEPKLAVKRVRIVTPTEEASAMGRAL